MRVCAVALATVLSGGVCASAQDPAPGEGAATPAADAATPPGRDATPSQAEPEGPAASWNTAENEVSLDMSWFAQSDDGGNPVQREGVRYFGARTFVKAKVLDELTVRASVVVADLEDGGTDDEIDTLTVSNANLTQASEDQRPITATLHADFVPPETKLKVTPGFYFFHQSDYQSVGGSIDLSLELNGGDTVPFFGFEARVDDIELTYWDGSDRGDDGRKTFSFLLGVTQVLSPKLVTSFSAQFVHQQGFMGDPLNRLALFANGDPTLLIDERLPRRRDRVQLNGRVRYSLGLGWSLGLDASGYADSWSIKHGALEPSFELNLGEGIAVFRLWYRFVAQEESRYSRDEPAQEERFQTADSDLGEFVSHLWGILGSFRVPLHDLIPEFHAGVFYYDRSDGVDGIQVNWGLTVRF